MINFRFHVVSLIAIFLALALGVVIGAGVIDRGVVDTLNSRLDRVDAKSDRIQSQNDALSGQNNQYSQVITGLQPFAVQSRLLADSIGIVAVRGIDGTRVKDTITASQQAGATVTGTLWLESKWALSNNDDVKALQTALGVTTKNKATLRNEGYKQLATRLALAPGDIVDPANDLLGVLQRAGFLGFDTVGGIAITDFPGRDAGVVLAVGTKGSIPADAVVVPVATAFHGAGLPLVIADDWVEVTDGPTRGEAVQPVRDSDLARTVSTVDDLDLPQGPTTVVLAMADLFRVPPVVGHYGYGPNAQPLPDPVAS